MTTLATGLMGAAVGGMVGAPGLGFTLGNALGQAFLGRHSSHTYAYQEGSRLSDLKVQTSQVGVMIPIVYGTYRIAGNVIWATDIIESRSATTQTQSLGGGGKGGHHHDNVVTQTTTTYSYSANFALGLCQGTILGIRRIWADGKLIYHTSSTATPSTLMGSHLRAKHIRFYSGSDDQLPDPLIEAYLGKDQVPAFRGLAYLVFEGLALAEFGNRLPNITVEVVQVGEQIHNLSHPLVEAKKPLSEALGQFSRFDGGVIHTQVAGNVPERVDLDLDLKVIQRFKGNHLAPNVSYHPIIKYMPHLFLTSGGQWYDLITGKVVPIEPNLGKPQIGVYGQGQVYCLYSAPWLLPTLVHYEVASPFEIPQKEVSRLSNLQALLGFFPGDTQLLDIDVQHGDVFVLILQNHQPYLFAFDPISAKRIKKWQIQLTDQPVFRNFNFLNPEIIPFNFSLNSTSTQILFTQHSHEKSIGFLIDLDFETDTLFPDPNETYTFDVVGQFCFLSDQMIYVAGSSNNTSKASIKGLHAIEPRMPTLLEVIENLCQKSKLKAHEIDLSELALNDQTLTGFVISQPSTVKANIALLQQAYAFDLVESGFQLKFISREKTVEPIHIENDDLAMEVGQAQSALIETHAQTTDFPQRIHILFTDLQNDYQQGHQLAQRMNAPHQQAGTMELPMALTPQQALQIAERLLNEAWSQRTHLELTLSRKYAHLDPSDLICINDQCWRINSLAYGDPGLVKVKAVSFDQNIYDVSLQKAVTKEATYPEITLATVNNNPQAIAFPSPTQLLLFDIPVLQDNDDDCGFYAAVSKVLPEWSGAIVAESTDNGQTFRELYSQNKAATYGFTQTALGIGKTTVFDEENTLVVQLTHGELSSVSERDLLNGANLAIVGQEILQFQNAILQQDGSYGLSRFLRGRKGTEWAVSNHQAHETFILVDPVTLHRIKSPASEIGLTRIYKAITYGRTVSASTPQSFINMAQGKKPLSPVHLQGTRNSAGDLTFTWIARTRIQGAWRDGVDAASDPEITGYEVDILKEQNVMRTLSTSLEAATYTAEQQRNDFGDGQLTIDLKLYAIGRTVGRGFSAVATL